MHDPAADVEAAIFEMVAMALGPTQRHHPGQMVVQNVVVAGMDEAGGELLYRKGQRPGLAQQQGAVRGGKVQEHCVGLKAPGAHAGQGQGLGQLRFHLGQSGLGPALGAEVAVHQQGSPIAAGQGGDFQGAPACRHSAPGAAILSAVPFHQAVIGAADAIGRPAGNQRRHGRIGGPHHALFVQHDQAVRAQPKGLLQVLVRRKVLVHVGAAAPHSCTCRAGNHSLPARPRQTGTERAAPESA